jgi:UDP-2,3-diacylglucosamine hydrolase
MSGPLVFLSDAHLGAQSPEVEAPREARLHRFLRRLPGSARGLVIVGDLFDFWFEYRTAIPRRHFATLAELRRVVEAGVPVTMLNGNHDFWLGHFLEETVGVRTVYGALPIEAGGRRLWVHHGDGLIGGDSGYKLLKKVLRSRTNIRLYQWLHPDLGIPLALKVSGWSRKTREHAVPVDRLWREIAEPRFAEGYDAVIIGHFHEPIERRENGREMFVLGDWISQFTYLELDGATLTLKTWE